jgi:class 3 adenylate cyclase
LEGIAKPGQILVGPATAELLRPSFRLNDQGMATLKGRPQPIRVEEIVGAL